MKKKIKQYTASVMVSMLILVSCKQEETTSPVSKNIEEAVFASGYIEQEYEYLVSANVDGLILSFPLKEGDTVAKNDLIAVIESDVQNNQLQEAIAVYEDAVQSTSSNSPELLQIQAQIDQARHQLKLDKENYLRYKELRDKNSVSLLDFEKTELQYKASQNNLTGLEKNYQEVEESLKLNEKRSLVQVNTQRSLLKDYELTAVESGQIINVFKKPGELFRRGEAIAKIASGAYIIKLFISEEDITKINLGQSVAVNINTYPNRVFQANITKIYPGFDETEQSYIVEAEFEQLPEKMFSGTQLQANIEIVKRQNVLVIPTEYVSKGSSILLENGEEKQIVTGSKNNTWIEVVSGISEKDVIVKPID